MSIKGNIVILSSIEWSFLWQRHQTFAKMFADAGWKVVFIESSAKRNPNIKDVPRIAHRLFRFIRKRDVLKKNGLSKNLTIISPVVFPSTYNIFRYINRLFFIPSLVRKIKAYIDRSEHVVVWCYLPTQTSLDIIKMLSPSLLIYDCVTNFLAMDNVPKDMLEKEIEITRIADIVIADSDYLFNRLKRYRQDVMKIPPGVNYALFSQVCDAKNGDHKICYFGAIDDRIDFDIIHEICDAGYEINMVGPVNIKLPKLPPSVKFIGSVPFSELPDYLKGCFCFVIPYYINDFTKGIIPAKIYECLATGKPVIATSLPDIATYFKDFVYIADTPEQFLTTINLLKSLEDEEKKAKRQKLAFNNSWEKRFGEILEMMEDRQKIALQQEKRINNEN